MGIVIKQSIKSSLISYIGIGLGFINTILLFPKMLSLEEFGLIKLLLSIVIIMMPILQLNGSLVTTRFYPFFQKNEKALNSFISFIFILPVFGFVVLGSLFLVYEEQTVSWLFSKNSPLFVEYYWALFPLAFFFILSNLIETVILSNLKSVITTFFKTVLVRALTTLIVLGYFFDWVNQATFIWLFVGVYAIQFLLLLVYFVSLTSYRWTSPMYTLKSNHFTEIKKYMLLIFLGGGGAVIIAQMDSIMSSYKLGLEYTGIYTIAFFIAVVIEIPRRNIIQIVSPLLTKAIKEKDKVEIKTIYQKTALNQFIASAFIFFLIAINLPEIYSLFPKNENYELIQQGMPVVLIVGSSFVFDMLMGCNTEIIHFSKIYYWNAVLTPLLAISAIGFNLYFIDIMDNGLLAIAYATMLTILVHNIIRCGIIYHYFKLLPFNVGHLKLLIVILVGGLMFFYIPTINNIFLSLSIKSAAIFALFFIGVIALKVSPDVNNIYHKLIRKLK
jgi:O-antigen/teichoic acid export membrane protein